MRDLLREPVDAVSSVIAAVEIGRAIMRRGDVAPRAEPSAPVLLERAEIVLQQVGLLDLSERIVEGAGRIGPAGLRTLDAIHLATARSLGPIEALITYDRKLAEAASASDLRVLAPSV